MPKERKKLVVLACLLMLWLAFILIRQYGTRERELIQVSHTDQGASISRGGAATPKQVKKRLEVQLKRSRLERERPPFKSEVRNIFASFESRITPSSPRSKPQSMAPPPLPDPFEEEAKGIQFLGYAVADGRARAFLQWRDKILVVAETQVFGNQFRVRLVKEDAVTLASLDGTREVIIRLGRESSSTKHTFEREPVAPATAPLPGVPGSAPPPQRPASSSFPRVQNWTE